MSHCDPIADMLTRIRNAIRIEQASVIVRSTKVCQGIAHVLKDQGYIEGFDVIETACKQADLRIKLKYGVLGEKVITEIKRVSKPSCRVYFSTSDLPKVMGGLGIGIVSTNKGVMSDIECRKHNVGGELLCTVC